MKLNLNSSELKILTPSQSQTAHLISSSLKSCTCMTLSSSLMVLIECYTIQQHLHLLILLEFAMKELLDLFLNNGRIITPHPSHLQAFENVASFLSIDHDTKNLCIDITFLKPLDSRLLTHNRLLNSCCPPKFLNKLFSLVQPLKKGPQFHPKCPTC